MIEHKTNSDIRIANTKRLTNILFRKGPMTKQELAAQLGISQPTVATILKELEAKGLVRDGEVMGSTGGRKPLCHVPIYDAKYSIGVESGRHVVRIIILDLGNNCVAFEECEMERDYSESYWRTINDLIKSFIKANEIDEEKVLSVGITIDETMRDGAMIASHESIATVDLDVAANFFDFEVSFQSSAKMAAIAQIWMNEAKDNFIYLSLGTNIRGAMVYDSQVIDFNRINCEFGYILEPGAEMGKERKLIDGLSAATLLERAGVKHLPQFKEKVLAGDELCNQLLDEFINGLSMFIFNLHMIFGWDVIIGGRLSPIIVDNKELIEN